jgi:hypothetical protein
VLKCKIIEYKFDEDIKIEIQGGSILVYKSEDVSRVAFGEENNSAKKSADEIDNKHVYDKEFYFHLNMGILGGYKQVNSFNGFGDFPTLGIGFKFSAGKALNRHLMLGAGIGWTYMDNYFMFSGHVPIFAEVRGDILKKASSLYYSLGVGYNIALKRNNISWQGYTMTDSKNGIYINPALGVRFPSTSKFHFCIEFNYAIHTASYSFIGMNAEIIGPTQNVFLRPTLAVALLF